MREREKVCKANENEQEQEKATAHKLNIRFIKLQSKAVKPKRGILF